MTSSKLWWCHDMESFSTLLALCEGNPPVTHGFPPQRTIVTEFWCFLWCMPEQMVEQTVEFPVICNAMALMWHHCKVLIILFWPQCVKGKCWTTQSVWGHSTALFTIVCGIHQGHWWKNHGVCLWIINVFIIVLLQITALWHIDWLNKKD